MATGEDAISAEDVHLFWFAGTINDPQAATARNTVWFGSDPAFDAEIRLRFAPALAAAARGELAAWQRTALGCVSLVVVLDQFPRNVHRNTAAAFAFDSLALDVTRRAVAAGYTADLSTAESVFLLMPYQHVEDVAAQREGLRLFERLAAEAPAGWQPFAQNVLDFARQHLEIVERFGRFPHRNAVLHRSSTPEEMDYLASGPASFGQGG